MFSTHLFSVGLKIIDQDKHPDNADKYNQFHIATHDDDDNDGYIMMMMIIFVLFFLFLLLFFLTATVANTAAGMEVIQAI